MIAFLESDQKTPKLDFSMKRQDNIGTFFVIRHYKKSRRAFALISFRQKFLLVLISLATKPVTKMSLGYEMSRFGCFSIITPYVSVVK